MKRILTALSVTLVVCFALQLTVGQNQSATGDAPGTLLGVIAEGTTDPFEIQRLATPLFGRHGPPIIENGASSYRIRYLTTGLDGEPTEVIAQLFVPELPDAAERPLFVFGSGTTGLADACAPSRESVYPHPLGEYRANLLAYAGRGVITIIPDYLGFNDPERLQSYFNAEAEARVMLDAVRAVNEFFARDSAAGVAGNAGEERPVFLGGYSQGGHAAFAAADLVDSYAPELELSGIVGFGATTDVETLLREGPYYAPYIVLSYAQDYGADLVPAQMIFTPSHASGLEQAAARMCVDVAQQHYPFAGSLLYRPDFLAALTTGRLADYLPGFAHLLTSNRTGLSGHGVPALVVQGDSDVIIRTDSQTRFVRALCGTGSDVLYLRFPGVRHRETRPAGFDESIAWLRAIAGGHAVASSCPLLLEQEPTVTPSQEDR